MTNVNLKGRSFLTLLDYTPQEISYLLDLARRLKREKRLGMQHKHLIGKNIVLLFEKTSTRTRCAFEVAGMDLGMGVTFLDPASSQMGKKESIEDTARVLGRMYDGIEFRGFAQSTVETLAEYSGVPVWNGLTDQFHPTQMLADLLTIEEKLGRLEGVKLTYMGDARNNMGNSLMIACAKMGLHFTACAPRELFPAEDLVQKAREIAAISGGSVTLTEDVSEGTADADVLYTDIWVSMGEPDAVWQERIRLLNPYQVNEAAFARAKETAIFMHCLPSFHDLKTSIARDIHEKFGLREMEVTDEVFESPRSVVFDEAENRMHTIKAVLLATLKEAV
ncbi:MAG TPA: ornithine carbamoyltransferase [Candidatus Pullichristensenella excrementigallinarum]|uniref:Ornithine carbamoyltransferase n=1 Tax=Candidatus Pullichristensenella excrementigallinarum TaxID=2840907 RepID=A0A9D1LCD0_9FIRM|nr:ornithine carbamoyltransferase [Candidatus Pullichristensenella excrementigallinarum]